MRTPVRTAVILGAGMGVRLAELGRAAPKGFLRLGERPIIAESIERLEAAGIQRIVIVTGHQAEFYEELARARPGLLSTVPNPRYATSGSLYSLWCARAVLEEDFLLLESDLIYERRALRELLAHPSADVLLVSGPTGAHDAVWVEAQGGDLLDMSKERARLGKGIAGELVGISKVSPPFLRELVRVGEELFARTLEVAYETDGFVRAARVRAMRCHLVADLVWGEIDDAAHLERARATVYPRVLARDGVGSQR